MLLNSSPKKMFDNNNLKISYYAVGFSPTVYSSFNSMKVFFL